MVVIVTLLWQNLSKSAFNYKLSLIDTFGDVGGAIAVLRCGECDLCLGMWGCDLCLGMLGVRSLFGMWGCDRFWGVGVRSLLWLWKGDRFWGVGVRSLFEDVGSAIAFGDVGVR